MWATEGSASPLHAGSGAKARSAKPVKRANFQRPLDMRGNLSRPLRRGRARCTAQCSARLRDGGQQAGGKLELMTQRQNRRSRQGRRQVGRAFFRGDPNVDAVTGSPEQAIELAWLRPFMVAVAHESNRKEA